jgi:hypothetical protein
MMSGTYSNAPCTEEGYKNFHYTSNSCGFFCDFIFYETRIPMVDMKVQVYSKFSKNKIWKKTKSPSSMMNGRFDTPKCRGKVQKMGVLCTHPPKQPRPLQHAKAFKN